MCTDNVYSLEKFGNCFSETWKLPDGSLSSSVNECSLWLLSLWARKINKVFLLLVSDILVQRSLFLGKWQHMAVIDG